jgi:ribonuclease R
MLKANELVALHLFRQGIALPYRVHDQPSNENIREFAQICRAFGLQIPEEPTPADLQALFDQIAGTPFAEYLANAYISRMRLACYSAENIGHFGLSLEHYCHFTSPIRRYIDLVIHRSLFVNEYTSADLELIATQCSEKERLSARAEQRVLALKKLRWLARLKEQDPYHQYEAVVTRVKNFGISFEVLEVMLEGFLHISELSDDYYRYDFAKMQLIGSRTGTVFQVADKVTVQLNLVDFILMESRWHIVEHREGFQKRQGPTLPKAKDSHHTKSEGARAEGSRRRRKRKRK